MEEKITKRLIVIGFIFTFLSMGLLGRLYFIQIMKHDEYTQRAVNQRLIKIPVSTNRGDILDKNSIPFTDRDYETTIIAYPYYINDKVQASEIISKATNETAQNVQQKLQDTIDLVEFKGLEDNFTINMIKEGKVPGVLAVERLIRYTDNGIARHIIGKIDTTNIGIYGLEKKFEDILKGEGSDSVVAVVDSGKNIIPGLGIRRVQSTNNNIILTLDYHIQKILEEVMDAEKLNGAIVVMDIKNGNILGMASRPNYSQNKAQMEVDNTQDYLNKAVNAYNLGSIFKVVVTAAALENRKVSLSDKYKCEGTLQVGDKSIKCSTYETHKDREIDINEAFALSCNTSFVSIGMKTGGKNIIEMAERFGLGTTQAVIRENKESINVLNEATGQLPKLDDGISNISIGQGSLMATPLQITSVIATIANDGIRYKPRIIDSIVTDNGVTIKKFSLEQPQVVISPSTSTILKSMMRQVTISGTGTRANIDELGGSSGKTGTAEAGEYTHAWFSGFLPSDDPKYAITVFLFDGKSGGAKAAPIFRQVGTNLLNLYSE